MKTPYYLIDEQLLEKNLKILQTIKERTGCKILLAQKCFSMFSVYPLIAKYLDGTTASGLLKLSWDMKRCIKKTMFLAEPIVMMKSKKL